MSTAALQKAELDAWYALQVEIYNTGARNFLFVNVPPMDLAPAYRDADSSASTPLGASITSFNANLRSYTLRFKRAHRDTNIILFDAHTAFTGVSDRSAHLPGYEAYPQNHTSFSTTLLPRASRSLAPTVINTTLPGSLPTPLPCPTPSPRAASIP